MEILVFGDFTGNIQSAKRLLKLNFDKFDFALYTGDTPDPSVFKVLRESKVAKGIDKNTNIEKELIKDTIPFQALKKATKEVIDICKILKKIPIPLYGVLGNADLQYYSQFVNWPFISLHRKIVEVGKYALLGYNGRSLYQFEKENKNENAFSEKEIEKDLDFLFQKIDPRKTILVTHAPPFEILDKVKKEMRKYAVGTYGEKAKRGNIGSLGLRKVVEIYSPLLHVFGHIHEDKGVVRNKTVFINAGTTGEDEDFCVISINKNQIKTSFRTLPL